MDLEAAPAADADLEDLAVPEDPVAADLAVAPAALVADLAALAAVDTDLPRPEDLIAVVADFLDA